MLNKNIHVLAKSRKVEIKSAFMFKISGNMHDCQIQLQRVPTCKLQQC